MDILLKDRMEVQADMPTKLDRWISARQAATILTSHTDHEVSADYVRMLAKSHKIAFRAKDGRTNEYNLADIDKYRVRPKYTERVRPRPSTRKERNDDTDKQPVVNIVAPRLSLKQKP